MSKEEIERQGEALYLEFVNSYIGTPAFASIPAASKLECVIVEPRNHPALKGVLHNVAYYLPNACMTLYHSRENQPLADELRALSPNLHTVCFRDGNMKATDYSALLKTLAFWEERRGERVLIFQTDAGLRKNNVAKLWRYGYVGAPWNWLTFPSDPFFFVGNGGLSLRDPALMRDILLKHPPNEALAEDVYFAHAALYAGRLPDVATAAEFAVEYLDHPDPMGFHQAYRFQCHTEAYRRSLVMPLSAASAASAESANPSVPLRIANAHIEDAHHRVVVPSSQLVPLLHSVIGPDGLRLSAGTSMWGNAEKYASQPGAYEPKVLVIDWLKPDPSRAGSEQGRRVSCMLDPDMCVPVDLHIQPTT